MLGECRSSPQDHAVASSSPAGSGLDLVNLREDQFQSRLTAGTYASSADELRQERVFEPRTAMCSRTS